MDLINIYQIDYFNIFFALSLFTLGFASTRSRITTARGVKFLTLNDLSNAKSCHGEQNDYKCNNECCHTPKFKKNLQSTKRSS
jgi:hypothetical protein